MPSITESLKSQFCVRNIVESPCPARFLALLNQTAQIKRPYDSEDGIVSVNEYGEVVMKATLTEIPVVATIPVRLVAKKGEGLGTEFQGKIVDADLRVFFCPTADIRENDRIVVGNQELLVLRVNRIFNRNKLHHKECLSKNITWV